MVKSNARLSTRFENEGEGSPEELLHGPALPKEFFPAVSAGLSHSFPLDPDNLMFAHGKFLKSHKSKRGVKEVQKNLNVRSAQSGFC